MENKNRQNNLAIVKALASLTLCQKKILFYNVSEGLSQSNVAKKIGCSTAHISRSVHSIKKKLGLRNSWGEYLSDLINKYNIQPHPSIKHIQYNNYG